MLDMYIVARSIVMPKVQGPLFSISASGRLGDGISYQRHNIGHNVRARKYKKKLYHEKQIFVRKWFKKAYYTWRNNVTGFSYYISAYCEGLRDNQKNMWIRSSVIERMTGINSFMGNWIKRSVVSLPQYQLPGNIGFCLSAEWTAGELIAGGKFIMGG